MYSKFGKKISNDDFDYRLSLDFPKFVRISNYINSKTKISISCKDCGKVFNIKPKFLNKLKCNCIDKTNSYRDKLLIKNIIPLENYLNIRHKIKHMCLRCENIFITSPKSVLNSSIGCPSCSGKIFSIDKYKSKLPNNIILLDTDYFGSQYKYLHKCLDCNFEFLTKPNYILHMNTNCPNCSSSMGERKISEFLSGKGYNYIREYVVGIEDINYRFDFFIEDLNLIIEFDGIHHFKDVNFFKSDHQNVIKNDIIKNNWCESNGIRLLRIPYFLNVDNVLVSFFETL